MAGEIRNLTHLRGTIRKLIDKRRVFVYVLFDERVSQQKVANFLDDRFDWLNSLADARDVYILFFSSGKVKGVGKVVRAAGDVQNPSLQVAKLFRIKPTELPGIVIFSAYKFIKEGPSTIGLPPEYMDRSDWKVLTERIERTKSQTRAEKEFDDFRVSAGIFLPLQAKLFTDDSTHLEEVFANLFSILQKHQREFNPDIPDKAKAMDTRTNYINRFSEYVSEEFILGIKDDVNKLRRKIMYRDPLIRYLNGGVKVILELPFGFLTALAAASGTELVKKIFSGKVQ